MVRNRAWTFTCNYKTCECINDNDLESLLKKLEGIRYFKFSLEKGEKNETLHRHGFLYFQNYVNFHSIQEVLNLCHIEPIKGDYKSYFEYLEKTPNKGFKSIEWGNPPSQGKRTDLAEIMAMSKALVPLNDIRDTFPAQFIRNRTNIEKTHYDILTEKYMKTFRNMNVIYMFGKTGTGKTSYVLKKYNYEVFRVTNYKHPFDGYQDEQVILFEEFRDSIPISEMLNYLDGHPTKLKARYQDRVACYTKVYIISNWSFCTLYKKEQKSDKNTYDAFKRRIHFIGSVNEVKEYERNLENDSK